MSIAPVATGDNRTDDAVRELTALISARYPATTFKVGPGEEPPWTHILASVDVPDDEDVLDLVVDPSARDAGGRRAARLRDTPVYPRAHGGDHARPPRKRRTSMDRAGAARHKNAPGAAGPDTEPGNQEGVGRVGGPGWPTEQPRSGRSGCPLLCLQGSVGAAHVQRRVG